MGFFTANDKTCEGCAERIRSALETLPTAGKIAIDLSNERSRVEDLVISPSAEDLIKNSVYIPFSGLWRE